MKTETLHFEVTEQERKLIAQCAKEQGTTVSRFVRGIVIVSTALDLVERKSLMQLAEVVEKQAATGEIPRVKIGRTRRIRPEDIHQHIAANRRQRGAVDD